VSLSLANGLVGARLPLGSTRGVIGGSSLVDFPKAKY